MMNNSEFIIAIMTKGRLENQVTLSQIPVELHDQVMLVVYPDEYKAHKAMYPTVRVVKSPDDVKGIAKRREWIAKSMGSGNILFQMDDDLTFCKAKDDGRDGTWPFLKFRNVDANLKDWKEMINDVIRVCDTGFPIGGFGQRISPAGIASYPGTKLSRVYTNTFFDFRRIDPNDFDWVGTEWGPDEFCPEDFHIQAQFVAKGFPTFVFCKWGTGGNKTQAAGGCATTRTVENHNAGMERFVKVWPQATTIRYKDSWVPGVLKAAITLRLSKLYPGDLGHLNEIYEIARRKLGGDFSKDAKILEKQAVVLRAELQANAEDNS